MWKLSGKLPVKYFLGFAATKRLDHGTIVNILFTIVKRYNAKGLSRRGRDIDENHHFMK